MFMANQIKFTYCKNFTPAFRSKCAGNVSHFSSIVPTQTTTGYCSVLRAADQRKFKIFSRFKCLNICRKTGGALPLNELRI
jgi:hypothetical protein